MQAPIGYSRVQIALHWAMAVLIFGQLILGDQIGPPFRAALRGEAPAMGPLVWGHIAGGIVVLLLVMWRLVLRADRGVPPAPDGVPLRVRQVGHAGHAALYALMVLAPMTGIVAWFGLNPAAGAVHQWFKPAFLLLIAGHVLAALWHQFWRKDGLLARMRWPRG